MTLKNFVDGGYDVAEAKILVCVKSIGAKKKGLPYAFCVIAWTDQIQ